MLEDARRAGLAFGAAALVALFPLGCSNSDGPALSTAASSSLEVFFDPNPAPVTGYGEYQTVMCVVNMSSVGIYIHGALEQPYSPAGEPYQEESHDDIWYKHHFSSETDEGAYLPGGEGRCVVYIRSQMRRDAYADWTFFGEDEFGNEVEGTGRLYWGAVY